MLQEPPDDVRSRDAGNDYFLASEEKETTLVFSNDKDFGTVFTEIRVHIDWVLGIEESEIEGVRLNNDGDVIAIKAKIPKGIVKFQASPRSSNYNSQMVSEGAL